MVQTTPGLILEMEKSVIDGGGGVVRGVVAATVQERCGRIPDGVAEAAAGESEALAGVCRMPPEACFLAWSGQG